MCNLRSIEKLSRMEDTMLRTQIYIVKFQMGTIY